MTGVITDTTAVMHKVTSSEQGRKSRLGCTVVAQVEVNGMPTEALIDTGSPATIISTDFVMEVLAKERDQYQSKEDWQAAILKRFSDQEVTLKDYGGQLLNILSQIPVESLTRRVQGGCHHTCAERCPQITCYWGPMPSHSWDFLSS